MLKLMDKKNSHFYAHTFCVSGPVFLYSKTCLKRTLKNTQNNDLNDRW